MDAKKGKRLAKAAACRPAVSQPCSPWSVPCQRAMPAKLVFITEKARSN